MRRGTSPGRTLAIVRWGLVLAEHGAEDEAPSIEELGDGDCSSGGTMRCRGARLRAPDSTTKIEIMSDRINARMPTVYLPHGGGPCFFMEWTMGPRDTWERTAAWLRGLNASLPETPRALLVVSAHWEADVPAILASEAPPLYFDYYGFPPHTYELSWPAPGDPPLAKRVSALLGSAGIETKLESQRGFDHGVFVPLKVAYPEATVPTVQLSLREGLDPAEHLAIGRALEPLRDEGVLIVGSGMSYHNMRGLMSGTGAADSERFDAWLASAVEQEPTLRDEALTAWTTAPAARATHPREEHLMPLMVVAGAAGPDRGRRVFRDKVMGAFVSAVRFG